MEIRLFTIALNNVDLPTLGRPTTATNGFDILSPHIVTPITGDLTHNLSPYIVTYKLAQKKNSKPNGFTVLTYEIIQLLLQSLLVPLIELILNLISFLLC